MLETCRPLPLFALACLLLLIGSATSPAPASAQTDPQRSWALVPLLGFGVVGDNGEWESGGVESALEIEYGGAGWRWSGYVSERGLGMSCSHACFTGGPALAVGVSRSLRSLWIGGGIGIMKQFGVWDTLPYGRISLDAPPLRFDLRVELPQSSGGGVYVPLLVGFPISR